MESWNELRLIIVLDTTGVWISDLVMVVAITTKLNVYLDKNYIDFHLKMSVASVTLKEIILKYIKLKYIKLFFVRCFVTCTDICDNKLPKAKLTVCTTFKVLNHVSLS